MPTRCNRGFYCRSYCLLNMFRAPLCPSSGAQEYYTVVAAGGISCCGFQVAGLVWSWGLCVRFAGCPKHVEQAIGSAIKTSVASSWHFISTYERVNIIAHLSVKCHEKSHLKTRTKVLPYVLREYETRSLISRIQHTMMLFEVNMQIRIFGWREKWMKRLIIIRGPNIYQKLWKCSNQRIWDVKNTHKHGDEKCKGRSCLISWPTTSFSKWIIIHCLRN